MAGRKYDVLLAEDAEQDLESIYDYIAEFDYMIADGRRAMQSLFARRLLRGGDQECVKNRRRAHGL